MIDKMACGRCKRCIKYIAFYIGNLSKIIFKRLYRSVILCQLLWLVVILCIIYVLWTFNDIKIVNVSKITRYPKILWWTESFSGTSNFINCSNETKCYVYSDKKKLMSLKVQAYLFYASNIKFNDLPLPRRPKDIIWGLYHEESPRNVEELLHEETLKLFNFSSTFSRYSDVPFPLQYLDKFDDITDRKYFIETSVKNKFLTNIAPVLYLQSDCETSTERDAYVQELMKYINVDSYGQCLNNKDLPLKFKYDYLNNLNEEEFLKFIARYKFVIAIENGVCNDYVTEKFWRTLKVGNVPIYFGSPSIRDWFPNNKSAILIEDFPTPKILSEHIKILMLNDNLYEEYLEHKTKQMITNERLKNEFIMRPYQLDITKTIAEFECHICKMLYDKMNGKISIKIVDRSHYDCPKPISVLTLKVNPLNSWVYSWHNAQIKAQEIYRTVIESS